MAKEIQAVHSTSGATLYAMLFSATGGIYNSNGFPAGFEAYQTANIADYDIALTEQGTASKIWMGDMPAVAVGVYGLVVRVRAGGAPAESDSFVTGGQVFWSGTALQYLGVPQTGDAYARLGAPAGASVSADIAALPAAVWAVGTRTLTSFGTLVADIWSYATRTLTSVGRIIFSSPVTGTGDFTITQGCDYDGSSTSLLLQWSITGYPTFVGATSKVIALNKKGSEDDSIEFDDLTIVDANTVKWTPDDEDSASIPDGDYDVQIKLTLAGGQKIVPFPSLSGKILKRIGT